MPAKLTVGNIHLDLATTATREFSCEILFSRDCIDAEARTVKLSFSSETPVLREDAKGNRYWEVLDHSKVDMSRMREGSPLLFGHNKQSHLGSVVSAEISGDRVGRALVKFGRGALATEKLNDVIDGHLRHTSVGGDLTNAEPIEDGERGGIPVIRFRNWAPTEISLTPLPADSRVGIGRSTDSQLNQHTLKTMTPEEQAAANAAAATAAANAANAQSQATATITREAQAAAALETTRMAEISAIGAQFKVPSERVIQALTSREPLEMFRSFVLKDHLKSAPVTVSADIGMSRTEKRRYSLQRAINRLSNREPLDGLEKEASDASAKQLRRDAPSAGFIMPHDVAQFEDREMIQSMLRVSPSLSKTPYGAQLARAMQTNNFVAAGALVATDFLGGSFIEILRNRMLLTQLGVGTMSGLVGNIAIPRQSGAATAYWLAEGAAVTASAQAFAQLGATPKRLAAQTAYSKQLLAQSSLDAEAIVRDDLMRVIAIAKDLAGIAGTGGAQPTGILNGPTDAASNAANNSLQTVAFGGAATWANILAFETAIQTQNADISSMSWLSNPTVRNRWKQIAKIGNTFPVFLCGDNNQANGYDVNITNQVGTSGTYANRAIFGAWAQAMFFDWAGMDVVVDPYTRAANNEVVVTMNMFADFGVRHWPSFCVSTDTAAA